MSSMKKELPCTIIAFAIFAILVAMLNIQAGKRYKLQQLLGNAQRTFIDCIVAALLHRLQLQCSHASWFMYHLAIVHDSVRECHIDTHTQHWVSNFDLIQFRSGLKFQFSIKDLLMEQYLNAALVTLRWH